MMLRRGEGYFSQTELWATTVSIGVTNFLSVTGGGLVPLWFVDKGFNAIGAVKLGASITDYLHLAGSAATLFFPGPESTALGVLLGTATLGSSNLHASVSVGRPFRLSARGRESGNIFVGISGNVRVSSRVSFVSETWIMNTSSRYEPERTWSSLSGATRIFGGHWADLGLVKIKGFELPMPWVSFSYTWGR